MNRLEEQAEYKQMNMEQRRKAAIRAKNRRKRRNQVYLARFVACMIVMFLFVGGFLLIRTVVRQVTGDEDAMETALDRGARELFGKKTKHVYVQPDFAVDLLTVNEYSRPGEELPEVKNIFVHYTANAGTSAAQNRSYFENLATTGETSASAHFVIGYEGEMIQCIPLAEIGYAVKGRNYDSISIECCYLEENGEFTQQTYESLIKLTAWLLGKYDLNPENVLRHYDEGGKNCPKYYVEHEDAWETFKKDLTDYIELNGTYEKPAEDAE